MIESPVQAYWNEHLAWSATANRLKQTRDKFRTLVLILTISGAALETLAVDIPPSTGRILIGLGGTVALAFVPFLTRYFLAAEKTRDWLRARSISEGIKSEIYRYSAQAEPYTTENALDVLTKNVREIRDWGKTLDLERAKANPRQSEPPPLDAEGYLKLRVRQQIDEYYRKKARLFATRSEQFRTAEIILAGIAAMLSAAATFFGGGTVGILGPWVAVLTTVGGSVAAHAAAGRFDFQATTFFATARQLEDLALDWQRSGNTAPGKAWSEFVRSCEEAISAENRGWMAKLDERR